MSTTTYSTTLPTPLLPLMQEKVDKANRKAARSGLGEPFAMHARATRTIEKEILGQKVKESWTDIEVTGESPALPGWHYAAKAIWDDADGVILNVSPWHSGGALPRPTDRRCEHCNKIRSRKETHLVAGPDGEVKQVGTSCLEVYTGINVGWVSLLEKVATDDDEDWGLGGYSVPFFDVAGALKVATQIIDALGYAGKNAEGLTTKERFLVAWLGARTDRDVAILADTRAAMATRSRPEAEVVAEVEEILAWGETLTSADSDYLLNLHTLLGSEYVSERMLGYLLSAVPAFRKEKGRIAKKAAEVATRTEVIEGRREIAGTIETVKVVESIYGSQVKIKVLTDEGAMVWGTLPAAIRSAVAGDKVTFTATFQQSRDDKTFGFFSRPAQAAMVA